MGVRGECVRGWECERVCGSEGRVCKGAGVWEGVGLRLGVCARGCLCVCVHMCVCVHVSVYNFHTHKISIHTYLIIISHISTHLPCLVNRYSIQIPHLQQKTNNEFSISVQQG